VPQGVRETCLVMPALWAASGIASHGTFVEMAHRRAVLHRAVEQYVLGFIQRHRRECVCNQFRVKGTSGHGRLALTDVHHHTLAIDSVVFMPHISARCAQVEYSVMSMVW